jgi:cytochrome c peroxidase
VTFDNTAIFFSVAPSNNGLLDDDDDGVGEITGLDQDLGKFKSPSLRNVALTGPYMHDGRFETLEEVVDHYNQGVEAHPNLDPALTDPQLGGAPIRLELGSDDQDALVAFMLTLTDASLATDPRWADPF